MQFRPAGTIVGMQRRAVRRFRWRATLWRTCLNAMLSVKRRWRAGELSERHGTVLLGAAQRAHRAVSTIAGNDPTEQRAPWEKAHHLSEQSLASMHTKSRVRSCRPTGPRSLWRLRLQDPASVQIATTQDTSYLIDNQIFTSNDAPMNRIVVIRTRIGGWH